MFHSGMIAWLLSPDGEHGYGDRFLVGFLGLAGIAHRPPVGSVGVTVEAKDGGARFDILIKGLAKPVRVENKTKTIGTGIQLNRYQHMSVDLIALGLCDESFQNIVQHPQLPCGFAVKGSVHYPLVTYRHVLDLLRQNHRPHQAQLPCPPKWWHLIDDYITFLSELLSLLDSIDRHYALNGPSPSLVQRLAAVNPADHRFLHRFFSARFQRHLMDVGGWVRRPINCGDRYDTFLRIEGIQHQIPFGPTFTSLLRPGLTYDLGFNLPDQRGIFANPTSTAAAEVVLCAVGATPLTPSIRQQLVNSFSQGVAKLGSFWIRPCGGKRGGKRGNNFKLASAKLQPSDLAFARLDAKLKDLTDVLMR